LTDDDLEIFWNWLKNIVTKRLSKKKQEQITEIFQKERKMEQMVYAIEKIMEQERIEAKEEGKIEGKIEGKREGKREGKIEVARKFIEMGIPLEKIASGTELPLTTIQKMAQSFQSKHTVTEL
jgi:predicted transposase/invertase (TIGR01784 family)